MTVTLFLLWGNSLLGSLAKKLASQTVRFQRKDKGPPLRTGHQAMESWRSEERETQSGSTRSEMAA